MVLALETTRHPGRQTVTTCVVGLKKRSQMQKSPKVVNPRDLAGNTEAGKKQTLWKIVLHLGEGGGGGGRLSSNSLPSCCQCTQLLCQYEQYMDS